eukprot:scaffold41049_cov69-Phaeocystis_antarctica.AAC.3
MPAACWARAELERGAELSRLAHTPTHGASRGGSAACCLEGVHTVYDLRKPHPTREPPTRPGAWALGLQRARAAPRSTGQLSRITRFKDKFKSAERVSPEGAATGALHFPSGDACMCTEVPDQVTSYVRSTTRPHTITRHQSPVAH